MALSTNLSQQVIMEDAPAGAYGFGLTGSRGTVIITGTWGTAQIQIRPKGGAVWVDVPNGNFTANAAFNIEAQQGYDFQIVTTGGPHSATIVNR